MGGDGARPPTTYHQIRRQRMNERPILITISNYKDKDITYIISQDSAVEILKAYVNSNELEELSIRVTGDIKEFKTEIINGI